MAETGIKIDDAALNLVMAKAVMTYLTDEKKDELLVKAVSAFFDAKDTRGYDKKPFIEVAFLEALAKVGAEVARELIERDPKIRSKMEGFFREAMDRLMNDLGYQDKLVDNFQRAVRGF